MHVNARHRLRRHCQQCFYRLGIFHWGIGNWSRVFNTSRAQRTLSFWVAGSNQILELDPNKKNCCCYDFDRRAPILPDSSRDAYPNSFLEINNNYAHHDLFWFVHGHRKQRIYRVCEQSEPQKCDGFLSAWVLNKFSYCTFNRDSVSPSLQN